MVTIGGYDGRVFKVTMDGGAETGSPLALTVTPEEGGGSVR